MSRLIDENTIIKMLNTMDRYTSEELTLCDTDETFPKNEVFIVDDVFEGLDELPSAQPEPLQPWEVLATQAVLPQPEIVRCKDCKYHHKRICPIERYFSLDGFCSRGERRQHEVR